MRKQDAAWTNGFTRASYNCGYGSSTTASHMLAGTTLYHCGTPVVLGARDEELGLGRPWVYFSTCLARVEQFKKPIQTFQLSQNLPATYADTRGGEDYAEDFFKDWRAIAYFSAKECEVVIRSTYIDQYLQAPSSVLGSIWYALTCCCRCC